MLTSLYYYKFSHPLPQKNAVENVLHCTGSSSSTKFIDASMVLLEPPHHLQLRSAYKQLKIDYCQNSSPSGLGWLEGRGGGR